MANGVEKSEDAIDEEQKADELHAQGKALLLARRDLDGGYEQEDERGKSTCRSYCLAHLYFVLRQRSSRRHFGLFTDWLFERFVDG